MELRMSKIDGKFLPVVRDDEGVDHIINNVHTGLEMKNIAPRIWEVHLSSTFYDD